MSLYMRHCFLASSTPSIAVSLQHLTRLSHRGAHVCVLSDTSTLTQSKPLMPCNVRCRVISQLIATVQSAQPYSGCFCQVLTSYTAPCLIVSRNQKKNTRRLCIQGSVLQLLPEFLLDKGTYSSPCSIVYLNHDRRGQE